MWILTKCGLINVCKKEKVTWKVILEQFIRFFSNSTWDEIVWTLYSSWFIRTGLRRRRWRRRRRFQRRQRLRRLCFRLQIWARVRAEGILKSGAYRKLPKPRACCNVWAKTSYLRMSASETDRRANFIASSKWSRRMSGTGSKSSSMS